MLSKIHENDVVEILYHPDESFIGSEGLVTSISSHPGVPNQYRVYIDSDDPGVWMLENELVKVSDRRYFFDLYLAPEFVFFAIVVGWMFGSITTVGLFVGLVALVAATFYFNDNFDEDENNTL